MNAYKKINSSGYINLGRKSTVLPPYQAQRFWCGGDLQTLKSSLVRSGAFSESSYKSQHLIIYPCDGSNDQLHATVYFPETVKPIPLILLVHGLTGSETSEYMQNTAHYFLTSGYKVMCLNLRGAGPSVNSCRERYHAGRSIDIKYTLDSIPKSLKNDGVFIIGFSLGGNIALKFASENKNDKSVKAVATVCAPINLRKTQIQMMRKRNYFYHKYLLNKMKQQYLLALSPNGIDAAKINHIKSIYQYDDEIVAPENHFRNALDYYTKCSTYERLDEITIPCLLIHSKTDPWIPYTIYTDLKLKHKTTISVVITNDGGHVGFYSRLQQTPWYNVAIAQYFNDILSVNDS